MGLELRGEMVALTAPQLQGVALAVSRGGVEAGQ